MGELKRRLLNLFVAVDQLLWVVLTLGNGHPDETISAAAWRMEGQAKIAGFILRPLVDGLFHPFEREHCRKAHVAEFNRSQLPEAYR